MQTKSATSFFAFFLGFDSLYFYISFCFWHDLHGIGPLSNILLMSIFFFCSRDGTSHHKLPKRFVACYPLITACLCSRPNRLYCCFSQIYNIKARHAFSGRLYSDGAPITSIADRLALCGVDYCSGGKMPI